ncbi:MAG TPA: KTSC domain-containing protein [Gemmatimonadaceae bacterium]|nr:KTSC domain-containing protein [Gemmatimonadaceae bacterium]
MVRQFVVSSSIRSVGFDSGSRVLEIEFCTGGIYQFHGVPEYVFDELLSAPSIGKYYQHRIKESYDPLRVGVVAHVD